MSETQTFFLIITFFNLLCTAFVMIGLFVSSKILKQHHCLRYHIVKEIEILSNLINSHNEQTTTNETTQEVVESQVHE